MGIENGISILYVEDVVLTAIPVIQQLEMEGFSVVHVTSGEQAIDTVASGPDRVNLILMDINLGVGMDGTETAKKIFFKYDIPIVFYSSQTEREIIEKTQDIVSYGYVAKPANFSVLSTSIKMAIKLFREKQLVKEQQKKLEAANDALRASEENFRTTLASIGDAVITADRDGNITNMNPVAESITEWTFSDAKGKKLNQIFKKVDTQTRSPIDIPYEELLKNRGVIQNTREALLISKMNREINISESGAPIKDDSGQIIGFVWVFRDITKDVEIQEQLQKRQKLESIGVLAGGIAHDFNNLFAGIFGYIELAVLETKEQNVKQYLNESMSAINRARSLTDQLLTFSKGGTPKIQIQKIFPFLQDTAKFALSGSNVNCNFDVQDDLYYCFYDKNQITQVVENLVRNAQESMPGGGTIVIKGCNISISNKEHAELRDGDYVKISVIDSGTGIKPKDLKQVFDPFFSTKPKGHGLGLSASYSIIKQHGGTIEIDTKPGKGSTFSFYLPAKKETQNKKRTRPAVPVHKGTGKIVLMDDQKVILDSISFILNSFGYDVICKENGEGVIEYLKSSTCERCSIKAMIFDLTIPGGMGGKETIEKVREIDKNVPVFVSSGYADDPIMAKPEKYGFTASIGKPFKIAELVELLNKYL